MNEWMNEWIKENVERKKELPTPPVPSNPDGASEGEPEEDDPSVLEIFVAVQSRCRPYLLEVSGASMEEARAEVIDWCWKNFARTGVIFHMQPANICGGSKPCWK